MYETIGSALKGLENDPETRARLLKMWEMDLDAVIESRKEAMRRNDRLRIIAVLSGLLSLIATLGVATFLALNNHDTVAVAVAAIGISKVIAEFINAANPMRRAPGEAGQVATTSDQK